MSEVLLAEYHLAQLMAEYGPKWGHRLSPAVEAIANAQTAAEREDFARRIISAIDEEINSRNKTEAMLSRAAPSLASYATQLRQELLSDEEPRFSSIDYGGSPEDNRGPQRRHIALDVAITGAFLTGCPLHIGVGEYGELQRRLATKLSENTGEGWTTCGSELHQGTDDSEYGLSSTLQFVVARRAGPDALVRATAILDDRPRSEHKWLGSRIEGWKVTTTSIRIDVYDFGVAVINGTFAVEVPAEVTLAVAARTLKGLVWLRPVKVSSPITGMFRELSKETTRQFREAVFAAVLDRVERPWLPKSDPAQESSFDWGRPLWLHPVVMLANTDPAIRDSNARELAPTFSKTVSVQDGRFVSGVGWSAIVTDLNESARDVPLKLLHLHWACLAMYMEIDRGLLALLGREEPKMRTSIQSEWDVDAERVFTYYRRVVETRSRINSALASLAPDEQVIWEVISDVQRFGALIIEVDRKVEVLPRIAERSVQQATLAWTRRSTMMLGLLTTLTLMGLAIALVGYYLGVIVSDTAQENPGLRFGFLSVASVLAVLLWWVTFRVRPRRKRIRRADLR